MRLSMFARLGRNGRRLAWSGALAGLLLAASTTVIGDVSPEAKQRASQDGDFSLFAGPTAVLTGNQLQCGLVNRGFVCTDVFDSPTGGGGFWPVGTPNAYIFNTGLQVAGIIGPDGGPWANDTTGAFFFDSKGTTQHGDGLTPIYDSLNPDDAANWPPEAQISDPDLYQPVLLGRDFASQQDSWVQYWDGNPAFIAGRTHPLGIQVTQRSLAWNYPAGNESLIYFVYDFENVSNTADFQIPNETQFFGGDNALPDDGYTINEAYAAFGTDMDVSDATENFSTAILTFDLGLSYTGGFNAPEFSYTPDLFFPPFFTNAPGLIGVKYLKSPIRPGSDPPEEVGLTLFGITINGGDFNDAQNVRQLWRYLSGKLSPAQGDEPCNVEAEVVTGDPNTAERSVCFIEQTSDDTRFFQASGPFELPAGGEGTIVVAYIAAPTVATMPDGSPSGIIANAASNSNPPGDPSFHPGFTSARGCTPAAVAANDLTGCIDVRSSNPVKNIERGAGWFQYNGPAPSGRLAGFLESPDNKLDQFQVEVVPNSLLGRALVAQTIFDSKFLLGFAPEAPSFYLVPGDNNVTVIWDESVTEVDGDPFFAVASDPASALYNPNYRQFDVEGYRVWRGTNPGALGLIAQFDKDDTTFDDYTCETVATDEDVGALDGDDNPVIGYAGGDQCPGLATDPPTVVKSPAINSEMIFNNGSDGGLPGLGVARLADGSALPVSLTNVIIDDTSGPTEPANDTGIPFFYVDNTAVNNFTYFYSVTAFDVNSQASGPHSLRSARVSQSTVPRADAPNLQGASLQVALTGDDGEPLDPTAPMPTLDPEDGTWSGPMPPTDQITLSFAPLLPRLLPQLQLQVQIDSITTVFDPGSDEDTPTANCPLGGSSFAVCEKVWMSYTDLDGNPQTIVGEANVSWWGAFGTDPLEEANWVSVTVPFDRDALNQFGIPDASGLATADVQMVEAMNFSSAEGSQNRRSGGSSMVSNLRHGGSRWFAGENESTPDPTRFMRVGNLPGVDTIFAPMGYTPFDPDTPSGGTQQGNSQIDFEKICHERANALYGRQADVQVTWGEGGAVTVRDVTHNVDVPHTGFPDATYGFIQDANLNGVIDWQDFNGMPRVWDQINDESIFGGGDCDGFNGGDLQTNIPQALPLQASATLGTVHVDDFEFGWADPANGASTWTGTGSGFGLYINGQRFIFQMAELPAPGTVWTLRSYAGGVSSSTASFNTLDPSGYNYSPTASNRSTGRPVLIPGLVFNWLVEDATNFDGPTDLTQVHTVPDPYLTTSQYDLSPTTKQLMFVNLPPRATIRIYTLTGVLVDVINHDDVTGGGRAVWGLRNRNNQFIASGVYFFHVATPEGDTYVGKFTVVNFGGQN